MMDLTEIRKEIDQRDAEILRLFEERMHLSEQVAAYKIGAGKPVFDRKREEEKLKVLREAATGSFNAHGVEELFRHIMAISRMRQYQLMAGRGIADVLEDYATIEKLPTDGARVVFQGVEGAYSFAAMKQFFGDAISSTHVETWKEAMEQVAEGSADYAVLPIENTTAGSVLDIYDLMLEYRITLWERKFWKYGIPLWPFRAQIFLKYAPFTPIPRPCPSAGVIWRHIRNGSR